MSTSDKPNLVTINIDGKDVQVSSGTNVIEAASQIGTEVPHYCYHPKLSIAGNCRMCLIEMGLPMRDRETKQPVIDENGHPKINWMSKPQIGCATNAVDGMHIRTNTQYVKDCQEGIIEFLLVNHPLDCPICDQAGECSLQEFATDYGRGYSRFIEEKNVKPKRTVIGPRITLDDERCILCSRCVRFSKEIAQDDVLGFVDHGSHSTLTCYPGKTLDNNYSLNTVDICPVGALTSTDFRFKMRVWFLKKVNSLCTESSVGVNTEVCSREGKIYRITPRRNDEVNDTWMTDSGRELYKQVEAETRLTKFKSNGNTISSEEAFLRFSEILPTGPTAFVGSSHMSVEEQFLIAQLVNSQNGTVHWISHIGEGDGLLISSDRTPNLRGALLSGLIKEIPENNLNNLASNIQSGKVQNLVVFREDLTQCGVSQDLLKKINLIYLGTHDNESASVAKLVIPTLTVFEKSGTFINQQWRLQKFHQSVPGPPGLLTDLMALNRILTLINKNNDQQLNSPQAVWAHISKTTPSCANITFEGIPDIGLLLNASAFSHLNFPEGETLNYKPNKQQVATD